MNYSSLRNPAFLVVLLCAVAGAASGVAADFPPPPPKDFMVSFIPKPWEVNTERGYVMLGDGWKFIKGSPQRVKDVDTAAGGVVNPKRYTLRDGSTARIGTMCENPSAVDCDDSTWITVSVPFNWYDLGEKMDKFVGVAWYRKTFDLGAESLKGKGILNFWGVYYRATVFVNGQQAGSHEGGYTPFSFDVTKLLKQGRNLVAVKVSNEIGAEDIQIGDWWNYGGIHREVFLETVPETYIEDISAVSEPEPDLSSAEVIFSAEINGVGDDTAAFYIYRLDGDGKTLVDSVSATIAPQGAAVAKWKVSAPALWSPETPNLYFVKAVLFKDGNSGDGLGSIFGIRKFEVRGRKLFLNYKEVFFRGVNRHDEFFHGAFSDAGRVMTEEERISDFRSIKDMNANAMRTAHYPNHPYNYFIADRLGIMTIEEGGPIGGQLDSDDQINKLKVQLGEMVRRDKNHPSIVIWSIGNEFGGDKYLKYIMEASKFMRSIDGRALTFTETAGREALKGYAYVDILSRNEYVGWYSNAEKQETPIKMEQVIGAGVYQLLDLYHSQFPDKPIFIMETGAESVCGQHAADPASLVTRGDEEYQQLVLKYQFQELLKHDYVVGTFPWVLSDFKTKSPTGTCQFTPHLNRKGLLCPDRKRKLAYSLVKDVYASIAEKYGK